MHYFAILEFFNSIILYIFLKLLCDNFSQLWLDRTCLVNLKINSSICNNLHQYSDIENQVQEEVTRLNIVGNYIETIPEIIVSLLLGR